MEKEQGEEDGVDNVAMQAETLLVAGRAGLAMHRAEAAINVLSAHVGQTTWLGTVRDA